MKRCALLIGLLATAAFASNPYGVCAHLPRDEYPRRDDALKMMSAVGIRIVRADIDWSVKRTAEAPWDFSRFDAVLDSAEREGVTVLPILNSPPKWVLPVTEHLDDFRLYVREVMKHVAGRCPTVEVWNEENLPQQGDLANPTNYLKMLKVAHEEIKSASPQTKVAFGGVAEYGYGYLREIYRLGGAKYFDIFCCHPYTLPYAPEGQLDAGLEKLRRLMAEFGDGAKPIWITELGYPTHRNGVGTVETQVFLSGLRIARPDHKHWRVAYAPIVSDGEVPRQFADELLSVLDEGSTVAVCSPKELKTLLATNGADAVVYPMDSEGYPSETVDAVVDFVRRGGILVETGGAPMYFACVTDGAGNIVADKRHNPEADRRRMRIGFTAWWCDADVPKSTPAFATSRALASGFKAHPAGYSATRFVTPQFLEKDDEFIPLVAGKSKSGKELSAAAVLKFNGTYKGAVVVCGLQKGFGPVAHSESQQATYLVRATAIALAEGVEAFFPYEFRAGEHDPYYSEHHFGIVHWNMSPKPAFGAYATLIDRRPSGSVAASGTWHDSAHTMYYPQWTRPNGVKAGMIWSLNKPEEQELAFDSDNVTFMDTWGKPFPARRIGSRRYRVRITDAPIYFSGGRLAHSAAPNDGNRIR